MRRPLAELVASGAVAATLLASTVIALSADRWPDSSPSPAAPPPTAPASRPADSPTEYGRTLFLAKGCNGCHMRAGQPGVIPVGPDLTDLARVAGTRRPGLPAEEYVRESLRNPQAFVAPGYSGGTVGQLPPLPLRDAEVDTLTAFLLTPAARP